MKYQATPKRSLLPEKNMGKLDNTTNNNNEEVLL